MQAKYFFRSVWRMFDFKGTTGRAEYFTYAVASFLTTLLLSALVFFADLIAGTNFYLTMLPEMLNIAGPLWSVDPGTTTKVHFALWTVFQFPMLALTSRRLRDQNTSLAVFWWLLCPPLGTAILFGYGFRPTFQDYAVTRPDAHGRAVMKSEQIAERRSKFRSASFLALVDLAIAAATTADAPSTSGGMRLVGG
jgi:uncharacterized membrane protein YhaH (DUF805 family)